MSGLTKYSNEVRVFVSTEEAIKSNADNGQWFTLNNYTDKSDFLKSAAKYATDTLNEEDGKIVLVDLSAGRDVTGLLSIEDDFISDDLWSLFQMSDEDGAILNAYVDYHQILDEGVQGALEAAKDDLIGRFSSAKDFVIHKLREAGANDEVIDMLGDNCEWDNLESDLNEGFMVHNYYFDL